MKYLALLTVIFSLTACNSEHTVDWYKQHEKERKERVKECRNDAAKEATADCQNAIKADQQVALWGNE